MTTIAAPAAARARTSLPDVLALVRVVVATMARGVVVMVLGLALWAAVPAAIGWQPTTEMTGSMEPRLTPGDVVVSRPVAASALHVGQVLLAEDPDRSGALRLHRFVATGPDSALITKGDANPDDDSTPVRRSAVHGVAVLRVPFVGLPVLWIRDHEWSKLLLLAVGAAVVLAVTTIDRRVRNPAHPVTNGTAATPAVRVRRTPADPDTRRGRRRTERRHRRVVRIGTIAAVLLVTGGLTVGPAAAVAAGFGSISADPTSTLRAATTFPCLARTVTNSPTFSYQFSAATGMTEADAAGNGRTGTLGSGATRVGGTCADSPYVTLDGVSGQVTGASNARVTAPTTFSLEAWIRTTGGGDVISFGDSQSGTSSAYDRTLYIASNGRASFGVYNDSTEVVVAPHGSVADGQWHHLVATLGAGTMTVYVDGVATGSTTGVAPPTYSGWWRVGYDDLATWQDRPSTDAFAGDLDDVTVYPAALTAAQVATLDRQGR
ncbi:LamG-like jellyroll fold domain-containing protein [Microbacterium sp. M1A1_1b]